MDDRTDAVEAPAGGGDPDPDAPDRRHSRWIDPVFLAYFMGPAALPVILVLMHYGLIVHRPAWMWLIVFVASPLTSRIGDHCDARWRNPVTLHTRVALQAGSVTTVIYLTGWGPVLTSAFAFLALENVSKHGSRTWRVTLLWSFIGITVGQIGINAGFIPSFLHHAQANALAAMGFFILAFIIRMAGATMGLKERAEAETRVSEDRFRSLIQNSTDTTLVIADGGVTTYASPAIEALLGFPPADVVGKRIADFIHPDDRDRLVTRLIRPDVTADLVPVQCRMLRADGSWCDVEAGVTNQLDRPAVQGWVANVRDITERKEFEAILAHRALHDPLTGLANRQLILDRAEQMLARSRRSFAPVAAYFIDLDNFKDTNDSLGHDAGDKLLQSVAHRLDSLLRASDTVGRMGGDEFVILAEGFTDQDGPDVIAERIQDVLKEPFRVEGYEDLPITVTASIGIATGEQFSAQELLRDADIALYRAKAAGRDCAVRFEPAMQSAAVTRLELRSDLDSALADGQFFLLYQPIFDLDTASIRGVEALIRWQHPIKGVVPPNDFIPVLEDSGMIIDVGRWVLDTACRQAAEWRAKGFETTMSVNVSMRQLESEVLIDQVRHALADSGLPPDQLVVEVTESTLMRDATATLARLRTLKEIGVLIAIDDFGTGYSSLAYLRQFPVDVLKIDRSFIAEMDDTPNSAALIHTLVELGHTLGLVTLAEGIEEPSQWQGLRDKQCDRGQGFIFSRPVEAAAIERLLTQPHSEVAQYLASVPGA